MNNITINKKSITRDLWIQLDIDSSISYKLFCDIKDYHDIIDTLWKENIEYNFHYYSLDYFWEWLWMNYIDRLWSLFLKYNYKETFQNILLLPSFSKEKYDSIQSDNQTLWTRLDSVKWHKTDNNYFYGIEEESYHIPVSYKDESESYIDDSVEKEISDYQSIQLTQTRKSNRILDYLYFLTIVSDKKIFAIINPYKSTFIITTQDKIYDYTYYNIIISLTPKILATLTQESQDYIQTIKDKYPDTQGNNDRCIADILEAIKLWDSSHIELQFNKGEIKTLDFSIRDNNLDKYSTLKAFKRWVTWVTRSTSIEEYWTEKKAVTTKWKINYKKKK